MAESEQFEKGLKVRRQVLGPDYVDGSIAKADDFMMAFQRITTEWCWGYAWTRPGLDLKTRSMLNLAMLTAMGKPNELKLHIKGAAHQRRHGRRDQGNPASCDGVCRHSRGTRCLQAAHEVLKAEGAVPSKG